MKISLVGRAHLEGISSKSGRPYNINRLHCLGRQKDVDGQAAIVLTVDASEYPFDKLRVGTDYIADFDPDGRLITLEPAGRSDSAPSKP